MADLNAKGGYSSHFVRNMEGYLSPAESGKYIASNCENITIIDEGAEKVGRLILEAIKNGTMREVEFAAQEVHPKDGGRQAVDWVFFMDTINFSFWPDEGKKFDVSYKGKSQTGYFAACAAANKALERGIPITSAEWMASATLEQVSEIFTSDSGHVIPLVEERVKAIIDSGKVLLEKWDGSFYNCVAACEQSAQKLLQMILQNFGSFRDCAEYKGQKVSILKRAQILILDVCGALEGDPLVAFDDFRTLTMFADYRVPQAMAFLGVLQYSEKLIDRLRSSERLENGSEMEVELRGCSIEGCERIVAAIEKLRATEEFNNCRKVGAADVDVFLWIYRRKHAKEVEEVVPFHRTRCIYY